MPSILARELRASFPVRSGSTRRRRPFTCSPAGERVDIQCGQCGVVFQTHPHRVGARKFCSRKCYRLSTRRRGACAQCGQETPDSGRKFCSRACSAIAQQRRVSLVCADCGVTFTVPLSDGGNRYCSQGCASRANCLNGTTGYIHSPSISVERRVEILAKARARHWVTQPEYAAADAKFFPRSAEKGRATNAVRRAVQSGRLVRPSSCAWCGVGCKPHAHHHDYAKPLDVTWLCSRCHHLIHFNGLVGSEKAPVRSGHCSACGVHTRFHFAADGRFVSCSDLAAKGFHTVSKFKRHLQKSLERAS